MEFIVRHKKTGEVELGKFYFNIKGDVYEYSYSPVAGHFDNDTQQLRKRDDLCIYLGNANNGCK